MDNSTYKVGEPYKAFGVYGRIVEIDGGLFFFSTPHGTIIKSGFVWFSREASRLETEEDLQRLKDFEASAIAKGVQLYDGKLAEFNNTGDV